MMDKRHFLIQGDTLTLRPLSGPDKKKTFTVRSLLAAGSTAVCYDAVTSDEDGKIYGGTLKEFYPCIDTLRNTDKFRNDYIRAYSELTRLRSLDDEFARELNYYLPEYELYGGPRPGGVLPDDRGVFVWSRSPKRLITFDQFLKYIAAQGDSVKYEPAWFLGDILDCIIKAARGVNALHMNRVWHLDLKPGNFGVSAPHTTQRAERRVVLYDVNSFYYAVDGAAETLFRGTPYFRSPEVREGRVRKYGPRSDVYSLGTVLYYALNMKKNDDGYRNYRYCEGKPEFDADEYNNTDKMLASSALLTTADKRADSRLFDILLKVLKSALYTGGPIGTDVTPYASVSALLHDLNKAFDSLL